MIVLYHMEASTCSQKVRLALFYKELKWDSRIINLSAGEHLTPEYLKLNPNGVVPTIVDNGCSVYDSSAITEYLDDVYSDRPLRPASPLIRGHMRAWCRYIDEVPTTAIRVPSFNAYFAKIFSNLSDEERASHAEKLPVRKHFFQNMKKDGFEDRLVVEAMDKLQSCLGRMEVALRDKKWIADDTYTLADIGLTPTVVRLDDLGFSRLWQDMPGVSRWYKQIQKLDNFDRTYASPARDLTAVVKGAKNKKMF